VGKRKRKRKRAKSKHKRCFDDADGQECQRGSRVTRVGNNKRGMKASVAASASV
jgi:hypothetical protein